MSLGLVRLLPTGGACSRELQPGAVAAAVAPCCSLMAAGGRTGGWSRHAAAAPRRHGESAENPLKWRGEWPRSPHGPSSACAERGSGPGGRWRPSTSPAGRCRRTTSRRCEKHPPFRFASPIIRPSSPGVSSTIGSHQRGPRSQRNGSNQALASTDPLRKVRRWVPP